MKSTLVMLAVIGFIAITFNACKDPIAPDPCADGHDWEYVGTIPASEAEDGYEAWECSRCGDTENRPTGEYATGTAGLSYTLIDGDTAYSVSKGTVTSGAVFIPAYHRPDAQSEYLPVTEIEGEEEAEETIDNSFQGTAITSVNIPASVKIISGSAFFECADLASVNFAVGSVLETIGDSAFEGTAITSVNIPASVKTIRSGAFLRCGNLETVTFEANSRLETIGSAAFASTNITTITIPSGVETIDGMAFWQSSNFASIVFTADSKLKTIGHSAFQDTGLTSIVIPASVTHIHHGAFVRAALETVYYGGADLAAWSGIYIGDNDSLVDATRYYYSATQPGAGNFWRWVNGASAVW